MILQRVIYEIFESDAEELDRTKEAQPHAIDREIKLEGSEGESIYVSWLQDGAEFVIDSREHSFFNPPVPCRRDMGSNEMWARLIGRRIHISHLDDARCVLVIKAGDDCVYCSAFDSRRNLMGIDVIHVSTALPVSFR